MQIFAQKIELSVGANSGLFHYSGNYATPVSYINEGQTGNQNYTNNPYGSKNGFSYGGDVQAQYVSKSGFITGLQAGYEVLRSQVAINSYHPYYLLIPFYNIAEPSYQTPVKSQTYLQNQDINVNPYIGYRLQIKKIKIDLMPGVDIGFNISSYDKGKATGTDGTVYRTDLKRPDAPTDVRLKFAVAAYYKKWGLTAGYAHGLKNYVSGNTYINNTEVAEVAHSELLRFGLIYRIL
ncbi:MAG TPA: hypothetical protein DCO83_09520 [Mucilaginibacter sp.]|nr:hypothetical protein [Mucilaginibacter sp.]